MSSNSLGKKSFSRRSFVSVAGGAASFLAAFKAVAKEPAAKVAKAAPEAVPAVPVAPAVAPLKPTPSARTLSVPVGSPRVVDAASLPQADERVLRAVGSIKPGTDVYGWKIVSVHGIYLGAIPVIMADKNGEKFQVDVCAKDGKSGAPQPVITTKSLSFFLANGGNGAHPSDESKGLGAIALASYLGKKKSAAFRPRGLMTLRERNAAHPYGAFTISV